MSESFITIDLSLKLEIFKTLLREEKQRDGSMVRTQEYAAVLQ